ncbi:class I SAM-dependent RNA methyltransferase [Sphingomonas sp. GlSt437]|uniref:class I SAM-dependent RNA methyltransferase n=1 Tax=Sphingomonas sp. GlSt437 TaxID=3389970 RepID=UPI003A854FAE
MSETIIRVAARGDGVTASGRHIALAAPGDVVDDAGIVHPGPHRQAPQCPHFPRCGGCQLQHLDDTAYADFVRDRIAGALDAQGLTADIRPPLLSPPRSRRRASLHAERKGAKIILGFSEAGSHALVDIRDCAILHPALMALVAPLRALLRDVMPPRGRVEVRLTLVDQGVDVLLIGVTADGLTAAEALAAYAAEHRLARLAIDTGLGPETRWEPMAATITLGGVPVGFPHGSFLQPTEAGEAALAAAVSETIGDAATVADLFSGLGTFALALAKPGRKIYAAEAARDAALASKLAGAARNVFVDHRDLYRRPLSRAELNRFDAIVLDPPRAGAREQAIELAASNVATIAYVSCNPSSFARDVKIMCEQSYAIDWIQPVGQFRWSTHVELAARLSRPTQG